MTKVASKPSHPPVGPLVSIVIPVFNDEEYITRALDTATGQSLKNIEIICIDDKSTDNSVQIIQQYAEKDPRIVLIEHTENKSAFQARRAGVDSARANYILFLDGDDELHKDAAKLSYTQAIKSKSDIVGFGSRIIRKDGTTSLSFEKSVQPVYKNLIDDDIVKKLFEVHKPAQGSLWRHLFSSDLLRKTYSHFPSETQLYRTNDLPICFLASALAKKYTSLNNKLYVYHYYAGGSGSNNFDIDKFKFYTRAIDSVNLLGSIVKSNEFKEPVCNSYYSARLFVLSNILRQIKDNLPMKDRSEAVSLLLDKTNLTEINHAMASFNPELLDTLRDYLPLKIPATKKPKSIGLFTNNLHTGGVQAVVMSQAKYLHDAGFSVTIILLRDDKITFDIPDGVTLEFVEKGPLSVRLLSFESILSRNDIDALIDHNIFYNFTWPFFNLSAKSLGIKTLAWAHSFALRPMTEGSTTGLFLAENIQLIDTLVVLSKADVSYWKSLGHQDVYYLPNPPSPMLIGKHEKTKSKKAPTTHLNIIWTGRLQQATKKIYSLIDIAVELRKLTDDFTLTIIGPDSNDLTIKQVKERVSSKKLDKRVKVIGPKHGSDLTRLFEEADIYVHTSIIEGYPITLLEAQSYALPVVMFELPWLSILDNNAGIIQTPQKEPAAAAQEIYVLFTDKELYEKTSKASLAASDAYLSYDFAALYSRLLSHTLPEEFSPDINIQHMGMFSKWTQIYFTELITGGETSNSSEALKQKDAEITALKNSKAMRIGNVIASPVRVAKAIKHKASRQI